MSAVSYSITKFAYYENQKASYYATGRWRRMSAPNIVKSQFGGLVVIRPHISADLSFLLHIVQLKSQVAPVDWWAGRRTLQRAVASCLIASAYRDQVQLRAQEHRQDTAV
jgi:hypothetical protein